MGHPALRRLLRDGLRPRAWPVSFIVISAIVSIAAASAQPAIIQTAIDGPISDGNPGGLVPLAVAGVVLAVIETSLAWKRRERLAVVSTAIETDLRDRLYARLQALDVGFHDAWQSGQLVQRCIGDLSSIRRFVGFGAIFLVILSAQVVLVTVLLLRLNVALTVITLVGAAPMFIATRRLQGRYEAVSRQVQQLEGELTSVVEETATGLRAVKAFGRQREMTARFEVAATDVYEAKLERVRLRTLFRWALGFLPNVMIAAILAGGAIAVGDGIMTIGELVAFVFYVLMLRWPLEALGWILTMAEEASTAAERLYEVLDTQPTIVDLPGARPLRAARGALVFDDVRFAYPTAPDTEVLSGIDLSLEPGETVALVGATGSGKTTMGLLVPRLYDVDSGAVRIDGLDVRRIRLADLRCHVGVAFEDPTLFSMSVRENLLLGKPDASDDDVWEALATAHADDFVSRMPWGLDTRIGEQGMSLSGGQRQRVALARAVIGRPRLLVLDDPLSALDVHTEAAVEAALRSVLAEVTALVVVHRPSTVALADRAALLWDGRIVATGSHTRLMAGDDRYRALLAAEADDLVVDDAALIAGDLDSVAAWRPRGGER